MQKKFHHLSICFIIMLFACDTEDSLEPLFEDFFIKYYGGEGSQIGVDLVTLVDGGFVLLGESTTTGGDSQIMLVRTDALGNELWSKLYGGSQNEFPTDLEIEPDENLLIAANVEEAISGQTDVMFLRVNLEGAVLDSVVFGSPNVTEGVNSITVVSDGDIIGVGTTSDVDTQKPGFNAATDLIDFFSIRMNTKFTRC